MMVILCTGALFGLLGRHQGVADLVVGDDALLLLAEITAFLRW